MSRHALYSIALKLGPPVSVALVAHGADVHLGSIRKEGVAMREIVQTIVDLPVRSIPPEEASAHFGWLAMFAGHDVPASSERTRTELGWWPTSPGLIADLASLTLSEG